MFVNGSLKIEELKTTSRNYKNENGANKIPGLES